MDHEYFFAGSREKGEESSAWLARLGAPARLGDREGCSMIRTGYPPCGRGQGEIHTGDARRNRRAGAPKRANHALPSPSDGIRRASREDRERFTLRRRTAESPCGRAQARQPRTPLSPLLPILYFLHTFERIDSEGMESVSDDLADDLAECDPCGLESLVRGVFDWALSIEC